MKRLVGWLRGQSSSKPDVTAHPTPIRISKRTRTALILAAVALLGLVRERILVAVGSRGLGPLRRMRLSSVSTKALRAAPGPVLMYPREVI